MKIIATSLLLLLALPVQAKYQELDFDYQEDIKTLEAKTFEFDSEPYMLSANMTPAVINLIVMNQNSEIVKYTTKIRIESWEDDFTETNQWRTQTEKFEFDESGMTTKSTSYFNDNVTSQVSYQYDSDGKLITSLSLGNEGSRYLAKFSYTDNTMQQDVYEVDENNQPISNDIIHSQRKELNDNGTVASFKFLVDYPYDELRYFHNDKGLVNKIVGYKNGEIVSSSKTKYLSFDENGNWLEKTETEESPKRVKLTVRTIEYFD